MKKKKLHLIFAIAIGVVIIAATSYGVWKMNKDIDNINVEIEQNSEISDWQTYRNEEYGFELQYPKIYENNKIDWLQHPENYRIWNPEPDLESRYNSDKYWGISNTAEAIITISVYAKNKKEDVFKNFNYKLTGEKVLIGNNIEAEKINESAHWGEYYSGLLFIERDKFFYLILTSFSSEMKENEGATEFNDYQNILKTLKID